MYPALEIRIETSDLPIKKSWYDECLLRQMARACRRGLQKPSFPFIPRMSATFFQPFSFRADHFDATDKTQIGLGFDREQLVVQCRRSRQPLIVIVQKGDPRCKCVFDAKIACLGSTGIPCDPYQPECGVSAVEPRGRLRTVIHHQNPGRLVLVQHAVDRSFQHVAAAVGWNDHGQTCAQWRFADARPGHRRLAPISDAWSKPFVTNGEAGVMGRLRRLRLEV